MITLPAGTLLYRGIDSPPEKVTQPMRLNGEKILWTATQSDVAQTYIPDWGCAAGLAMPWGQDPLPHPDDGIVSELIAACGGKLEICRREWPLEKATSPETIPKHLIANGTFGRVTSWGCKPQVTWTDILAHLRSLGYDTKERYLWIKTTHDGQGKWPVVAAKSKLRGTLAIFEAVAPLQGSDHTKNGHDLLDPAYHHAAGWGENSPAADFLRIGDYCQTKTHGNVGHESIAILGPGLAKLRLVGLVEACHHEWDETGPISSGPTAEETQWRESQKQAA